MVYAEQGEQEPPLQNVESRMCRSTSLCHSCIKNSSVFLINMVIQISLQVY